MKRASWLFVAAFAVVLLLITGARAADQRISKSASIDPSCKFKKTSFVVPAGQTATNFSVTLSSGWLPCQGAGTPQRIGLRIPGHLYFVKYYNNKTETLMGNVSTLTLGPGTYTVEVPDGGPNTRGTVSFVLKGGAAPPATPAAGAAGWGTISGEWKDPTVNSRAKIVQSGNSMTITNSFMWEGKSVTWNGSGTVNGSSVRFSYRYSGYKPKMWENGTMALTRTARGTLKGKWTAASGKYSMPITFIQTKSDDKPKAAAPPMPSAAPAKKPSAAPTRITECPPGYIYGGPGRCMPPTMKHEDR